MAEALAWLHQCFRQLEPFVLVPLEIRSLNNKHDLYLASPHGDFPQLAEQSLNEWLDRHRQAGPVGDARYWREVLSETAEPAERFRAWIRGVREEYNRQLSAATPAAPDSPARAAAPIAEPSTLNPAIVSLGNRQYRIGNMRPVLVEENEDTVLQAFLEQASMDGPALVLKAGFDRAARVLNGLKSKYGGQFAAAIHTPGKRGQGGYHVEIRRNSPQ
jgi:hypothetical protein